MTGHIVYALVDTLKHRCILRNNHKHYATMTLNETLVSNKSHKMLNSSEKHACQNAFL